MFYNVDFTSTNKKGYFNIGSFFNLNGITSVSSLKTIKEKFQVTYDIHDRGRVFKVYRE